MTFPVAVAFVGLQLVQRRLPASSPSSAQVKIMLAGRVSAGPCPHTSTAGVTTEPAEAGPPRTVVAAPAGRVVARPQAAAATTIARA
jgi:hypothetical protein